MLENLCAKFGPIIFILFMDTRLESCNAYKKKTLRGPKNQKMHQLRGLYAQPLWWPKQLGWCILLLKFCAFWQVVFLYLCYCSNQVRVRNKTKINVNLWVKLNLQFNCSVISMTLQPNIGPAPLLQKINRIEVVIQSQLYNHIIFVRHWFMSLLCFVLFALSFHFLQLLSLFLYPGGII